MKKLLILFFALFLASCGEDNEAPEQPKPANGNLGKEIHVQQEVVVNLLPSAKEEILRWPAYTSAQSSIEGLKDTNLEQLKENMEPLVTAISDLRTTLPSSYRNPSIVSRVNVLFTKANVLDQQTQQQFKDMEAIGETASQIVSEFEYLKIQLNELFLQSPSDFEIDLEEINQLEQEKNFIEDEPRDTTLLEMDPFIDTPQ